jgi:hypothetical protein
MPARHAAVQVPVSAIVRVKTGDVDAGAPMMFVSMPKGALAQRAGLTSAQALTVIWLAHEMLPPANVWHALGDCDAGSCGAVKLPVRLPASSSVQVAFSVPSALVIEQPPADWASAPGASDTQIRTAGHSRIMITKAAILFGCRCRDVIA